MATVIIKGIDDDLYRTFKSVCALRKLSIKAVISLMMSEVVCQNISPTTIRKGSLADMAVKQLKKEKKS